MKHRLWWVIHGLSVEMLLVVSGWMLLWYTQTDLPVDGASLAVLLLSLWLGYQADHLMDTQRAHRSNHCPERLLWMWRWRWGLVSLWITVLLVDMSLAFIYLPKDLLQHGFLWMGLAMMYVFSLQYCPVLWQRFHLKKEWFVSALLAGAMYSFLPLGLQEKGHYLLGCFLLFLQNCLAIAEYEAHDDHLLSHILCTQISSKMRFWLALSSLGIGLFFLGQDLLAWGTSVSLATILLFFRLKLPTITFRSSMDLYLWLPAWVLVLFSQ